MKTNAPMCLKPLCLSEISTWLEASHTEVLVESEVKLCKNRNSASRVYTLIVVGTLFENGIQNLLHLNLE